jgi:hypothetical protein
MALKPPAYNLKRCYYDVLNTAEQATNYPVAFDTFWDVVQRPVAVPACK